LVLTSNHGLVYEQRDEKVARLLLLNGAFGHPLVSGVNEMKPLERHNNETLRETIESFQPEVIHVFSLHGLSKSLLFTLHNSRRAVVYDVFDHWLSANVREDPWLRFWNAPSLPFLAQSTRTALEMSGERGRLDEVAPTRMKKGYERLPGVFGEGKALAAVTPNSIGGFRFDHLYFCSQSLKALTEQVGFCVWNGAVIHPSISGSFFGDIKPATAPIKRLLLVAQLNEESGVMTAFKALKIARQARPGLSLHIYGRGESNYIAKLRSFAVSNALPVEFLTVPNQQNDLPAVYQAHDLALHTPEWNEPFPYAALRAMGCGVGVIGSAVGAAGELLRHGENALTYPSGDATQLAARIHEMLLSPALRVQMAQTAQEEALTRYNEATVIDQIESYLQNAHTQRE
jgi:glycosyltransferase involved in cell wall biosynthesis